MSHKHSIVYHIDNKEASWRYDPMPLSRLLPLSLQRWQLGNAPRVSGNPVFKEGDYK